MGENKDDTQAKTYGVGASQIGLRFFSGQLIPRDGELAVPATDVGHDENGKGSGVPETRVPIYINVIVGSMTV